MRLLLEELRLRRLWADIEHTTHSPREQSSRATSAQKAVAKLERRVVTTFVFGIRLATVIGFVILWTARTLKVAAALGLWFAALCAEGVLALEKNAGGSRKQLSSVLLSWRYYDDVIEKKTRRMTDGTR